MRLLDILGSKPKEHENEGYVRRANFAGSWYKSSANGLNESLSQFLADAEEASSHEQDNGGLLRGLVAPHAGYSYSGPTAAFAYRALIQALKAQSSSQTTTILVLHPSHYFYLNGCAVSGATIIETPLGNLPVNQDLQEEVLESSSLFTTMKRDTDEKEHSGEMQYPYIVKACKDSGHENCMVLPIMVGSLDTKKEETYGKLLAPIIARPNIITVVSSDFCHWGSRFQYQPFLKDSANIFESIEEMDKTGMTHIELQEPGAFALYLKQTSNTICGRHPIGVWLQAVKHNKETNVESLDVKFVRYAQSSQVRSKSDSSVSYASAVARRVSG
jgi:AmmeMemoRadiSam system protein B